MVITAAVPVTVCKACPTRCIKPGLGVVEMGPHPWGPVILSPWLLCEGAGLSVSHSSRHFRPLPCQSRPLLCLPHPRGSTLGAELTL